MSIIGAIIIGFIVGLVGRALLPGKQAMGFVLTTVLGIVGALLATWAGRAMGWYADGAAAGFIASTLGAIVVLLIYGAIAGRPR